ncbi:MAG: hypothetical protein ACR2MP_23495 [Streptosporangiaceae bacterium]
MHQATTPPSAPVAAPRRFDAGKVRVSDRDIAGLMLCGEMYGAPYDLLAAYLDVQPDRLRGIAVRWRAAGWAETGRLGPGPAWCWLTRPGLAALGLRFAAGRPSLGRLAHLGIHAAITRTTPGTLTAILADSGTPAPGTTSPPPGDTRLPISDSAHTPMWQILTAIMIWGRRAGARARAGRSARRRG